MSSGKKKSHIQAADCQIALKYRQQLRDEKLGKIREDAAKLFETWKTARREDAKQTNSWNQALNVEIENTLQFFDKFDEALDAMENEHSPGLQVDEDAIIEGEKAALAELMERYRPEMDLSNLEAEFARMAADPEDSKEMTDLITKVIGEQKAELEQLQEEKKRLEEKLEDVKKQSETREIRFVADKILLERKEKKYTEELDRIGKKRLEMEEEAEISERQLRETEEVIDDLKTEVEEFKKTVENLKFNRKG